ncbi:type IV secretion system protein VirB10 [Skermanella aerolata]|uniref:TrbI/VirB10 family protein n=1 Tax=Skermanella aerolata TaxID=393310 RepID=UPI003D21EA33
MTAVSPAPPPAPPPPTALRARYRRRMNRMPAVIGAMAVFTVAGAALYTMTSSASYRNGSNALIKPQNPGNAGDVIARAPPTVDIPADLPKPPQAPAPIYLPPASASAPAVNQPLDPDMMPMAVEARKKAWEAYYARQAERDERLRSGLLAALTGRSAVEDAQQANAAGQQPAPGPPPRPDVGGEAADTIRQHQRRFALGRQDGIGPDGNYLTSSVTAPVSRYELKATDIIAARMESGLITDSPGIIRARVARNVYDHATGTHILIPQGSTLVGTYDNAVAYGQSTVVTAWQRVIYPAPCDESLTLGTMPGGDAEGYAGFRDRTDNHYLQVFANAILLSLFSAGTQLSQPQAQNDENIGAGQTVASAMGQQLGQLGQEFARRGLDIPPTNQIRNGYPFTIMLTKDIAFARPWTPCAAPGRSRMEILADDNL